VAVRLRLVVGASDRAYASWEEIYEDNVGRVYGLMYVKVGNRPDAEDLTAEVFTAALPRLRETAAAGEVRGYLLATARTVLADHWRRTLGRQLTAIDPDELAPREPLPDPRPETVALAERVLDELPENYRTILRLRFLQAATIRDAARQMGITVANAKVLQHRALRRAAKIVGGKTGAAETSTATSPADEGTTP
jgi:RNA polymerase sigma-70 factor (ECF subfamily)